MNGVLFLIKVDGNITEKADLAESFTANPDGKQSFFFENSPITFVTRFNNTGNVHVKPSGKIELTSALQVEVKSPLLTLTCPSVAITGNLSVAGTFGVVGVSTFTGASVFTGISTFNGALVSTTTTTLTGTATYNGLPISTS